MSGTFEKRRLKQRMYKSPDEVFESLQGDDRVISFRLRELVLQCIPHCSEKLSAGAPFYYGNTRICYIWPGAIPWGNVTTDFTTLGFCRGYQLSDPSWLETENRKMVYVKRFYKPSDINTEIIRALLFEAAELDSFHGNAGFNKRLR